MPLTLTDLMTKAASKGITANSISNRENKKELLKPWQSESVIYNKSEQSDATDFDNLDSDIESQPVFGSDVMEKADPSSFGSEKTDYKHSRVLSEHVDEKTEEVIQPVTKYRSRSRLQKEILSLIYQSCKRNNSIRSEPLPLKFISAQIRTSAKSAKTLIHRLVKDECLIREKSKAGSRGWTIYRLADAVFSEISGDDNKIKQHQNKERKWPN